MLPSQKDLKCPWATWAPKEAPLPVSFKKGLSPSSFYFIYFLFTSLTDILCYLPLFLQKIETDQVLAATPPGKCKRLSFISFLTESISTNFSIISHCSCRLPNILSSFNVHEFWRLPIMGLHSLKIWDCVSKLSQLKEHFRLFLFIFLKLIFCE